MAATLPADWHTSRALVQSAPAPNLATPAIFVEQWALALGLERDTVLFALHMFRRVQKQVWVTPVALSFLFAFTWYQLHYVL